MRRWLALCGLMVGLAASTLTARAALQFDVFVGYDGVLPEANWFPVVCEVKNDGPPFVAIVELASSHYAKGQVYRMAVELPTGTLKRFVIPVFSTARYSGSWDARLLNEKGKVIAEQNQLPPPPRRQVGWDTPVLGSLARSAGGSPSIKQITAKQPELQPSAARLQPAIFPDNPLVLESLDAIYLNSDRAADLEATQISALLAWMQAGGHLIVGVEEIADVNAHAWLKRIVPVELSGMKPVAKHPELHEWLRDPWQRKAARNEGSAPNPFENQETDLAFEGAGMLVATGTVREGEIVAGSFETPLVVSARRGNGRVTTLMFSPEREPFRSWKNSGAFWAKLMHVRPELYVASGNTQHSWGMSIDGVFGAMVDSRQVRKLPVHWLLVLLIGYLVVIGPLDRFWLKKIRKEMLTWITFPIYVALFSGLIYLIGYRLRAGETEWNELHLVDVLSQGDRAELRGRTYASVYSPVNAQYKLASEASVATLRGEFMGNYGGGSEVSRARVYQRGNSFEAEIDVPVWTSQLYVSDWMNSDSPPVRVAVTAQGGGYQVQVENRLEKKLTNAKLVVNGRVWDLGELPPKQTKTFTEIQEGMDLKAFVQHHGRHFENVISQRQYAFGGMESGRISDLSNGSMAASFISQLPDTATERRFITPAGLDLSPLVERGDAVLLAWAEDYSPVKPINKFEPRRSNRDTLLRVAVPVKPQT